MVRPQAKKLALKRYVPLSEKGIKVEDLLNAVRESGTTTCPTRPSGRMGQDRTGERIVRVKVLARKSKQKQPEIERVMSHRAVPL